MQGRVQQGGQTVEPAEYAHVSHQAKGQLLTWLQ